MLDQYTTQEYREIYKDLPKKVKNLFWEDDIADRIRKIVERHELNEYKEKKIIRIVAHIFFGLLPPKNLKEVVLKEIVASPDYAERIVLDINRLIVSPTKHLLKEVYEEENKEEDQKSIPHAQEKTTGFSDAYREPIE